MREEIRELFQTIVESAMDSGFDIKLEWKDYNSSSNSLRGALTDSKYSDNGVVLSIYQSSEKEE